MREQIRGGLHTPTSRPGVDPVLVGLRFPEGIWGKQKGPGRDGAAARKIGISTCSFPPNDKRPQSIPARSRITLLPRFGFRPRSHQLRKNIGVEKKTAVHDRSTGRAAEGLRLNIRSISSSLSKRRISAKASISACPVRRSDGVAAASGSRQRIERLREEIVEVVTQFMARMTAPAARSSEPQIWTPQNLIFR